MQNRRNFIKKTATVTALGLVADWASAISKNDRWGDILPQRQLIRNGEKVSAFCLGGYHLDFTENEKKAPAKTGDDVCKQLDESLKALNTEYIDLWQIHDLQTPEDVENRIKEGVLDAFLEAKENGKTRYIGFTGHRNPKTHLYFLKRLEELGIELDTCQMPLNVSDPSFESFQHNVLPVLLEKEYGIIAMKTMAGGSMLGGRIDTTPEHIQTKDIPDIVSETKLTHANLHQYVYSLPVSSLCSGCRFMYEIEDNVEVLRNMKKLSESDTKILVEYAKPYAGLIVENYKRIFE